MALVLADISTPAFDERYGQPVKHAFPTGALSCVDFNFNGWGNKQSHSNDAKADIPAPPRQRLVVCHCYFNYLGLISLLAGAGTKSWSLKLHTCAISSCRTTCLTASCCSCFLAEPVGPSLKSLIGGLSLTL